jgi:hypothetical protein
MDQQEAGAAEVRRRGILAVIVASITDTEFDRQRVGWAAFHRRYASR